MTIEDALRYLAEQHAKVELEHIHGDALIAVKTIDGRACARRTSMVSIQSSQLSVLAWQLVSIVQELQRSQIMGNVAKRLKELHDIPSSTLADGVPASLCDLLQFAQIVDEELDRLGAHRQAQPEEGRKLVEEWGQTETKD